MALARGDVAPRFSVETTRGPLTVPDAQGRCTLVMFFQEAQTPTCTQQVASLNAEYETLVDLSAQAVCLSSDPPERLAAFAATLGDARVPLASDRDGTIADAFGVYDRTEKRAERSAFVVDGAGTIRLAIPWYNPANSDQFLAIFDALGLAEQELDNG